MSNLNRLNWRWRLSCGTLAKFSVSKKNTAGEVGPQSLPAINGLFVRLQNNIEKCSIPQHCNSYASVRMLKRDIR